ncbi:MAG: hypothetical protein K2X73_04830 [Sphingomonas sp.]|uniref:hypothetical protein n=1 Tax=Sphingomonas sp. TaxID=28214 RepID=UPI0025E120B4|nr:hypothetical protein [Sphingomonas sp.]MBX9881279.1 hypothetical protein [Sphingomonas sp.]
MDLVSIDLGKIVELGTQVATTGALRMADLMPDDVFEMIVGIGVAGQKFPAKNSTRAMSAMQLQGCCKSLEPAG